MRDRASEDGQSLRTTVPAPDMQSPSSPLSSYSVTQPPRGGRRISFVAWGAAALVGLGLWVLIFKLIV